MPASFVNVDNWRGGYYELAMEFAAGPEDALEAALKALWAYPALEGCYVRRDREPIDQEQLPASCAILMSGQHLAGLALLPGDKQTVCGTCVVTEEGDTRWLDFYLPMGSLSRAYEAGAYPFDGEQTSRRWREPLETWLADLGKQVYRTAPFRVGLVGFEASGAYTAGELLASGIPSQRTIGILWPRGNQLTWYPTNQWQHTPKLAS